MKSWAIVTLADSNYFELLLELLASIKKHKESENVSICVLDAGLDEKQIEILKNKTDIIKKAQWDIKVPSYKVVGSSGGKRNYEIMSGSSYYTTKVSPPKRGRKVKKKSKNDEVVKSNITEDTRIPPPDSNPSRLNEFR